MADTTVIMRTDGTRSRGQALPLFAVLAPTLLAFMGLGIDVAQALVERRDAQGAADLAALAGARHLDDEVSHTDQADARAAAVAVAVANGYSASQVTTTTPYDDDDSKIRVTIDSSVSTYFLPVLDLILPGSHATMNVDAHAVAYGTYDAGGVGGFAILALEGCPSLQKTIDLSGSVGLVVGRVHSNSDLYIGGSSNTVEGTSSAVCGNDYPAFSDAGSSNSFEPPYALGSTEPDPLALVRTDFTCDFLAPSTGSWDLANNGSWWVGGTKASKTLRAGTYCSRGSSGSIKLSDSDIIIQDVVSGPGGVTFLAQTQVEISGANFDLHPHEHDVLIFSEGTTDVAIKVAGSGGTWLGYIYAPYGTAELSGSSNVTFEGGVIGKRVKLNGSNMNVSAHEGVGGPGAQNIALIE